jgi:hypothetical protein
MSSQPASVGYMFDFAETPTKTYGNTFTFYFQNKTNNYSFDYDVSSFVGGQPSGAQLPILQSGVQLLNGSAYGDVGPGETVSVSLWNGGDKQAAPSAYSLQAGSAPLVYIPNYGWITFWFFTDGSETSYQQIAICNNSTSTTAPSGGLVPSRNQPFPITSTPIQTSSQMQCMSSTAGISITLDAGGHSLTTSNIYIEIANA